ncbi:MAG TPA: dTMP kinase [Acidimicrobiia bacterium]|nr:dTMP kinase [Acidimicrobiia bacterium]
MVLEGGEGSGKSTQVAALAARLRADGRDVVETLEPGGTSLGRELRALLLHHDGPLDARAELLLLLADRAQHVHEVVEPALARGADVVSDRYTPSTLAYQGVARDLGVDEVARSSRWAAGGLEPDLVIVLDVAPETAVARGASGRDRFERAGVEFDARVRAAYRDLAREHGWPLVDASGSPDEVAAEVWRHVAPLVR